MTDQVEKGQRIRIDCPDGIAHSTAVYVIQPDGTEIPITDVLVSVTWKVRSDEAATASLECEFVEVNALGVVDHVLHTTPRAKE